MVEEKAIQLIQKQFNEQYRDEINEQTFLFSEADRREPEELIYKLFEDRKKAVERVYEQAMKEAGTDEMKLSIISESLYRRMNEYGQFENGENVSEMSDLLYHLYRILYDETVTYQAWVLNESI